MYTFICTFAWVFPCHDWTIGIDWTIGWIVIDAVTNAVVDVAMGVAAFGAVTDVVIVSETIVVVVAVPNNTNTRIQNIFQ